MFGNIMVPSDGSEYSDKAVDAAIEIAKKFNSKITAVFVLDENTSFSYDTLENEGNEILKGISEKGKKEGVMVIEHLITADPLRDMKIIAERTQVDSIVINSSGKNKSEDLMIGSIASRVIETFDIPIVLVK
ncbi:putative universal stress protein [Methanobrevibacter arboriphilus JCM 13429 = DSM 1125]|uniref:Putative universal stress protein n=1 Tax=Methanobrevibacter arboriphilus JCM 13429 = DSM 1125 TaxID=1300164 RepID=A0A1V6N061_METAZ|nr:universal stress protein [Methanobrevibacter arboriphilus]OQD58081.1 putative universal stress protein [Methanobrevibacter arboriphilus JCM 13429 = DSM 1125]